MHAVLLPVHVLPPDADWSDNTAGETKTGSTYVAMNTLPLLLAWVADTKENKAGSSLSRVKS